MSERKENSTFSLVHTGVRKKSSQNVRMRKIKYKKGKKLFIETESEIIKKKRINFGRGSSGAKMCERSYSIN